jgi:hypothetical protein
VQNSRCDRCQEALETLENLHYTITIEIEAEGYVDDQDYASHEDQLSDIEAMIESADEISSSDFGDDWYQRRQYILCKRCYSQYIQNPLSKPSR